ncbi:MAG: iron-containing alcohol dehydrogenase [Solirubrobacteraceae bacterium]
MSTPPLSPAHPFRWQDGERLVVFGRGRIADADQVLGDGYALLTTPRAAETAPAIVAGAAAVHHVPPGRVDELAAGLRTQVQGDLLVALGGGRVIDTAKALAAADPPRRVAAIPTTLSGAEMTPIHRHATGVPLQTPRVRPAVVLCDPALASSQPLRELAQSAGNALGHAVEGPLTPLSNPVAALAALQAAQLLQRSLATGDEPDLDGRDQLALGALLAGYVIGSTGYGLHHVMSQTLVRFAGIGHGEANSIMLPHSARALGRRFSGGFLESMEQALGATPAALAERLRDLGGVSSLSQAGVARSALDECVEGAAARPELQMTPPPADASELRELYEAAY